MFNEKADFFSSIGNIPANIPLDENVLKMY